MIMRGRRQQNRLSRACFGMLLILSVMLRASIPDGFMPSAGKAGMAHITICPGMAGMRHHGDAGDGKDRSSSHSAPCAYTLVLAHDAPGQAPVIPAPFFTGAIASTTIDFHVDPAVRKPWFSRGPPQFLAQI
jgi:hypothetical protein